MEQIEVMDEVLEKDQTKKAHSLILFNDDHTPFEVVIEALIRFCKHTKEQSEQIVTIIHHKGKLSIKEGSYKELEVIAHKLHSVDLTCEIV